MAVDVEEVARGLSGWGKFSIGAEITVSEFRDERLLHERLANFRCLQVKRQRETIGVLVDTETWLNLVATVNQLLADRDRLDDQLALDLIALREPHATFEPGYPGLTDELFAAAEEQAARETRQR